VSTARTASQLAHRTPGVFLIRKQSQHREVVDHLEPVSLDGDGIPLYDRVEFLP
jgi:hypothetical protein